MPLETANFPRDARNDAVNAAKCASWIIFRECSVKFHNSNQLNKLNKFQFKQLYNEGNSTYQLQFAWNYNDFWDKNFIC